MRRSHEMIAVPGSEKKPLPNAQVVGDPSADERFTVTVRVRARNPNTLSADAGVEWADRQYMTRAEHTAAHGADPADLAKVEEYATEQGLDIVESSAAKREIILSGTPPAFSRAFGVELKQYQHGSSTFRGRSGSVLIPAELKDIVTGVFGLDDRTFARPHCRLGAAWEAQAAAATAAAAAAAPEVSTRVAAVAAPKTFFPPDVARLYNFPDSVNGLGQTIAILELGGGFRPEEVQQYFNELRIPPPSVSVASFPASGVNAPSSNAKFLADLQAHRSNPDGEVMLDIQVAGGVAPGAKIVVYFGRDASDSSFLQVLSAAVHDNVNKPTVISISWGGPEAAAAKQFQDEFNRTLQEAATLGISVCASAGDNGSADFPANDPTNPWDGHAHVDFPASSPFTLACGGTRLIGSGAVISQETVWHSGPNEGTGGGVSRLFPLPSYQAHSRVPSAKNPRGPVGRGVPDVAGVADQNTGYQVLVDGVRITDGGTSAVSPLWSGLIALLNQSLGKSLGFINPMLYNIAPQSGAFNDITAGNNGDYSAGRGWDACTGLGTPNGKKLLAALGSPAPANPTT